MVHLSLIAFWRYRNVLWCLVMIWQIRSFLVSIGHGYLLRPGNHWEMTYLSLIVFGRSLNVLWCLVMV